MYYCFVRKRTNCGLSCIADLFNICNIANAVVVDDGFLHTCSKVGTTSTEHAATSIRNIFVCMPSEDPSRSTPGLAVLTKSA